MPQSKTAEKLNKLQNLPVQIYEQVKEDIFNFKYLPGDKFSEGDIATQMNVSRTPVRQALFWLQQEGYIEVQFKSGWQVRAFDFKFFEDLYEVRILLEIGAIQKLAETKTINKLSHLRDIWCVSPAAYSADPTEVCALDEGFHSAIVAAVENEEMSRIHQKVTEKIRIIRRLDYTKAPRIDATYQEHAAILETIFSHDHVKAQQMLKKHIEESKDEVKRITLYMLQTARERYSNQKTA